MYLAYLQERYEPQDLAPLTPEFVAQNFEAIQKQIGAHLFKTETGFVTYRLQGDAILVLDMYVKPEARQKGEAWKLHNALLKLGKLYNKQVMITFSDHSEKNRNLGLNTIKAFAFEPAHNLKTAQMFIKGI